MMRRTIVKMLHTCKPEWRRTLITCGYFLGKFYCAQNLCNRSIALFFLRKLDYSGSAWRNDNIPQAIYRQSRSAPYAFRP